MLLVRTEMARYMCTLTKVYKPKTLRYLVYQTKPRYIIALPTYG